MSEIAASALTPAAVAHPRVITLSRVRHIGYALLALQLIGFMTWSVITYNQYALTFDYSAYGQGWYLIAHGHLNPFDTAMQAAYVRIHGELIIWPLALLYWLWPHGPILLWIQVCGVVAAEAVAFTWICELAGRRGANSQATPVRRPAPWLAVVGLILLVANPWIWWTVAWDYHGEPLAAAFLMLLLRDLANDRRRAWAWVLVLLLCGDVAGTYLCGAGLGSALANRQSRMRGLAVACIGVLLVLAIIALHANSGSGKGLQVYGYLAGGPPGTTVSMGALVKGALTHPQIALRELATKRVDMFANLMPGGLLGIFFVPVLPAVVVVLLANNLWPGLLFDGPGFQAFPMYVLVPAGTIAVLGWLVQRHRITAIVLSCLVAAQALGWAVVWMPRVPGDWLRVPADTVSTLAATHAIIPPGAEVVASQGISGRFSDRASIIPFQGPGRVPVHGETWFIIAPWAGIETQSTASAMAFIGKLAGPLGATLVTQANGVWVFRWDPPTGTTSVTVPGGSSPIEAWVSPGAAGQAVLSGPVSDWHAAATGAKGYVADQIEWQLPTGRYEAVVTLATSGPVNVEVWNETGDVLLSRRTVIATGGTKVVALPVDSHTAYPVSAFSGFGPFHADFQPPPPGQRLEVRVWSPGNTRVNVYSAELTPAG
jgi:hypothetical protein